MADQFLGGHLAFLQFVMKRLPFNSSCDIYFIEEIIEKSLSQNWSERLEPAREVTYKTVFECRSRLLV